MLGPAEPACMSAQLCAVKVKQVQHYWVFGLPPLSGILKPQKNTTFWKLDLFLNVMLICFFLEYQMVGRTEKSNNPECYTSLSKPFS
jgi:hypothetical protein